MFVLTYTGQNDQTLREVSKEKSHTLICLDSGESFRTEINKNYKPTNCELAITKRPDNVSFRRVPGLEAEDIRALFLIKNKLQDPISNTRTLIKKVLLGNEAKGIQNIFDPKTIQSVLPEIDPNWTSKYALAWCINNLPIYEDSLMTNYLLTSRELHIYMQYLPEFTMIYRSL